MRRLRRMGGDRGAVTALVAVLLSGGVLFGMGAIVIDVSRLYAEREQLQSAADAASWALAKRCITASTAATCGSNALRASDLANANAADLKSKVALICGRSNAPAAGLTACPAQTTKITDCIGTAPASASYVEVRTSTLQSNNSTLLPPAFESVFDPSYTGTNVGACSRVAWGFPTAVSAYGIAIGSCEWRNATTNGTVYTLLNSVTGSLGALGNYLGQTIGVIPTQTTGQIIWLHDTIKLGVGQTRKNCTDYPPGYTVASGYSYLVTPDLTPGATCSVNVTIGTTIAANDNYLGFPIQCLAELNNALVNKTPLLIPIYDGEIIPPINLNDHQVHIAGFAAFVPTAYQVTLIGGVIQTVGSLLGATTLPCTAVIDRCIQGYFTQLILPSPSGAATTFGTTDYGVTLMSRIG